MVCRRSKKLPDYLPGQGVRGRAACARWKNHGWLPVYHRNLSIWGTTKRANSFQALPRIYPYFDRMQAYVVYSEMCNTPFSLVDACAVTSSSQTRPFDRPEERQRERSKNYSKHSEIEASERVLLLLKIKKIAYFGMKPVCGPRTGLINDDRN